MQWSVNNRSVPLFSPWLCGSTRGERGYLLSTATCVPHQTTTLPFIMGVLFLVSLSRWPWMLHMGFGCDAHQSRSAAACSAAEASFLWCCCGPPMLFSLDRSLSASFKVSNREGSLEMLRNVREGEAGSQNSMPLLGRKKKTPKPRCFIELQYRVPLHSHSLPHIYSRYTQRIA